MTPKWKQLGRLRCKTQSETTFAKFSSRRGGLSLAPTARPHDWESRGLRFTSACKSWASRVTRGISFRHSRIAAIAHSFGLLLFFSAVANEVSVLFTENSFLIHELGDAGIAPGCRHGDIRLAGRHPSLAIAGSSLLFSVVYKPTSLAIAMHFPVESFESTLSFCRQKRGEMIMYRETISKETANHRVVGLRHLMSLFIA